MDVVLGVVKAYTTRVGEGSLPTEDAELADMLHDMGREFGATTGRARRCGWFDAVAARYATMINGIDELAITNLDGLDSVDPIRVCVGYRLNGKRLDVPPSGCGAARKLRADLREAAAAGRTPTENAKTVRRNCQPPRETTCKRLAELTRRETDDRQRRPGARTDDHALAMAESEKKAIPRHVAIIMDGNGRWAKQRGLPRIKGHEQGAEAVRECVEGCGELRIEFLTLYAFSAENWQRPKAEVLALMHLLEHFLEGENAGAAREKCASPGDRAAD